ncbi:MAG: hypothetical protein U0930_06840 [Pirellulales bacterium]
MIRQTCKIRRTRRTGFILLLVILLLAICCLIFTQIALQSFGKINAQTNRQRELEQYWATLSIRRAVLPHASATYQASIQQQTVPELTIDLADTRYNLRLENENTKLNLVRTWQDFPIQTARDTVSSELFQIDGDAFEQFQTADGRVQSWRDLNVGLDEQLLSQTDSITLWGQGLIDITQAEDAVIEQAWKGLFGTTPPAELYQARQSWPPPSWSQLRTQLGLRETQLQLADKWFTTNSQCFSLELTYTKTGNQISGYLFLQDRDRHHAYRF